MKPKLVRITTVPLSLDKLLEGQLKFMGNYFEVIAVSSDKDALQDIARKEACKVYEVPMTRKITPFKDLKSVWVFYKFLKKERPFIVHSHTPKAGLVAMLAAYLVGVPNRLHTVAGLPVMEAKGVKKFILLKVEKLIYNCSTKVYPNSQGLKNFILDQKLCLNNKLAIIGQGSSNGIDTNYFSQDQVSKNNLTELKAKLQISETDFVFIFVGRLVKDKGINELVKAFCKLGGGSKLLLVGPTESELDPLNEVTLKEIRNNTQIKAVGFQKDVRPYLAIANVLVFPSYREGFPNVVMQAGAMKLPVIASNINGCNEIIEHKKNGIIIPVKDSESIYKAMRIVQEDVKLYKSLKENTRERIVDNYEQKYIWRELLKEYKKL